MSRMKALIEKIDKAYTEHEEGLTTEDEFMSKVIDVVLTEIHDIEKGKKEEDE